MRRPLAIRTRLTLWYGLALGLTVVALGAMVWFSSAATMRSSLDEALGVQAADVLAGIDRAENVAITRLDPARPGIFTVIFGANGHPRLHSPGTPSGVTPSSPGTSTVRLPRESASYALLTEAGPEGQTIVVGSSLAQVDHNLANLALLLVGIGLAGSAASLAGGWLLSGRALAPVERLTKEATVIGSADLERRLPVPARLDEIGRLARTLNGMLDRVAESVRRERAFVSAASHDLRTPIAALRTELELAERAPGDQAAMLAAVRVAHADAVRLSHLAADLLDLAEAESTGRALLRQPLQLDELIEGAITRLDPLAAERGVRVRRTAPAATVEVDRVRLEQALVNLVANAIREGPEDSLVEVVASIDEPGRDPNGDPLPTRMRVSVLDRGPGVPAETREMLFVPFASRARGRAGGTGLGLATAAAAVRAHGGEIGYADRPGGGASFWFSVPLSSTHSTTNASAQAPGSTRQHVSGTLAQPRIARDSPGQS